MSQLSASETFFGPRLAFQSSSPFISKSSAGLESSISARNFSNSSVAASFSSAGCTAGGAAFGGALGLAWARVNGETLASARAVPNTMMALMFPPLFGLCCSYTCK
jgi:hypothetical protein